MSDCPNGLDLDEWSIEQLPGSLADHIAGCEKCTAYIQRLASEQATFLAQESPEAFVHRPAIAAELNRPEVHRRPFWTRFTFGALASLATAAVALFVMLDRGKPTPERLPLPGSTPDIVRMKGQMALSVVLKRDGKQTRYHGAIQVRPHDEIRVELTTSQETSLTVGIRTDDGEWMPLREGFQSAAGTGPVHDDAIVFDNTPTRGWIIAGTPDAVASALAGTIQDSDQLTRIRIEWVSE